MQMTDGEIKLNVMQAKDQISQITICADLNCCSEEHIKDILRTQGIDLRTLKGAVKKHIAETKCSKSESKIPYKKPEIIAEPPKKKQKTITLPEAMAAIRAELDDINRQQYELDMRKADLYKQLWDTLGEVR